MFGRYLNFLILSIESYFGYVNVSKYFGIMHVQTNTNVMISDIYDPDDASACK